MAERQFGPYRLVHQIATGGMAEIHLAKIKGIGGFEKYVALKMIHPNFSADDHFIQMLVDEAKITVQLQHVNIAQIFDLGRVGETFYITMEYVDGCDLYKVLRKASEQDVPMPIEICAHVAKEVCMGLDYAHRKRDVEGKPLGIVHRDVSPQNVLVSHVGEVKIVDFGIAKATMRARQTAVGVIKGKYYYMSPEQAWGDPVDHRTDIFSAGILLYEMLTGQMLYLEEDMQKLLDMVRRAEIPPPSTKRAGVPRELDQIVMRALAKKPASRWQSASDFGAALERFLHQKAPDFTTARLTLFTSQVLLEDATPPPVPVEPQVVAPRDRARVTQGLGRDAIMSRGEFADENSVIFRLSDVAKGAGKRGPAGSSRPGSEEEPTRGGVPSSVLARSRAPTSPPPLAGPSSGGGGGGTGGAGALAKKKPSGSVRLPNIATAHLPVPGEEREEVTVISDPPGFSGAAGSDDERGPADDLFDGPPGFDTEDRTADRRIDKVPGGGGLDDDDLPTGITAAVPDPGSREDQADDEPTRMDLGLPTPSSFPPATAAARPASAPAAQRPVSPMALITGRGVRDEDALDADPLEAPTTRKGRTVDAAQLPPLEEGAPRPANPRPAVSELAAPRSSRRTPISGVPIAQVPGVQPPGMVNTPLGAMPVRAEGPLPPESRGPRANSELPLVPPVDTPPPFRAAYLKPPAAPPSPTPGANPWEQAAAPVAPTPFTPASPHVFDLPPEFSLDDAQVANLGPDRRNLLLWFGGAALVGLIITLIVVLASRSGPPGTPAPATASMVIISIPDNGATVRVDGKPMPGVTPLTIRDLTPGKTYRIQVDLARYTPWTRDETIAAGARTVNVVASLQPVVGMLRVTSDPPNGEVFLNGQSIGRTPLTKELDPFTDGTIEVRLRGHKAQRKPLKWGTQREVVLDFKLPQAQD